MDGLGRPSAEGGALVSAGASLVVTRAGLARDLAQLEERVAAIEALYAVWESVVEERRVALVAAQREGG